MRLFKVYNERDKTLELVTYPFLYMDPFHRGIAHCKCSLGGTNYSDITPASTSVRLLEDGLFVQVDLTIL
jgi:hypothetical protein